MKFFVDTAEIKDIKELHEAGLVDGVTTNPSLIAKSGRDFKEVIKEICAVTPGPVSAEVASLEYEGMIAEGEVLAKIADNVVVKLPLTLAGLKAAAVEGRLCGPSGECTAQQHHAVVDAVGSIADPIDLLLCAADTLDRLWLRHCHGTLVAVDGAADQRHRGDVVRGAQSVDARRYRLPVPSDWLVLRRLVGRLAHQRSRRSTTARGSLVALSWCRSPLL